jgi:acyl transferase domain-containing protein/NADP-dependent 3-hydroxy acid dehydrogenase YdfG
MDQETTNSGLAIVGIGCLLPKAAGLAEYWANIKAKVDGIGPIPPTHWNPDDYFDADPKRPDMTYARRGGFLDPYPFQPAAFGIAPNDLEATDTSQLLALVVAQKALEDAGLADRSNRKISIILGVTGTLELVVPLGARLGHPNWRKALQEAGVSGEVAERVVKRIGEGYVSWHENSFPGLLGNVVAGRIANRLDLHGTNCVVDAACASSLSALHLASLELNTGRADVVVTGGVDTFNDIFMYMCFSKTPALSPTGDARPFDASGDGTILGEGLGLVVLKRLADAERDGDRVYAIIKGIGTSSDGKGDAVYAPSADGQVRCLRDAYKQAGVMPETVELIEAHGTGTKVGDATEARALAQVFRDASEKHSSSCALGSVKSQLGHTKAAAGAAGLIKAALALYHKVLPPTIKVTQPLDVLAPGSTPFYVNTECRPWLPRDAHPRRAGVSAFGFGGSNFHVVLEEHGRIKPGVDWDGDVQIVAFSGESVAGLKAQLRDWDRRDAIRARATASRATFNSVHAHRLTFVLTRENADDIAARALQLLDQNAGKESWHSPDGVAYGSGPDLGHVGFLFPGQGSQAVGMLRDLACTFPAMQQVLAEADRAFEAGLADPGEKRLSDAIYPHPAFTPAARATQEEELRATWIAQPALGAVSLGAVQVLGHFGVRPDAAAGHSYGELTALCAAGCFDAPSLFELSQLRGRLMAEHRDDAGAMLAVQAPLEAVEGLLADDQLDLVIANRNSPAQAVLSGRTTEIERAAKALGARQVRHVRLPVAAAFHSPLVAAAAGPFRAALQPIDFRAAQLPVFANSTAHEYPRDPQLARDLLAQQLAKPVEFVEQIRNMAKAGVRTFVEVGPGRTLTRLVESILENTPHHAVALDASAGQRPGMVDLAQALARLAALGHPVKLAAWDEGAPAAPIESGKPTLTVPICGANYRKPQPPSPSRAGPVSHKPRAEEETKTPVPPSPLVGERGLGGEGKPLARPAQTPVTPMSADTPPNLSHALRVTQESLAAFQRLQEQTAQLHRQFLETQESAQRTLQTLVDGQQRLIAATLGLPQVPPVTATALPAPQVLPPNPPSPAKPGQGEEKQPSLQPPLPHSRERGEEPTKSAAVASTRVQDVLLAVVAEKTGYPPEMLDLDMGLDADLGIDSIKRVEILSALQEQLPDAPAVKPEHLGTLHTLRHIVEFLSEPGSSGGESRRPLPDGRGSDQKFREVLLAVVAEKTGYPPEMLDLDMGLDADLGIDSIKRVEILSALQEQLPEAPAVKPEHLGTLQTLRQIVEFLSEPRPSGSAATLPLPDGCGSESVPRDGLLRFVPRAVPIAADRAALTIAPGSEFWLVADSGPMADCLADSLARRDGRLRRFDWDKPAPARPARLGGLILVAPEKVADDVPSRAFRWLQLAGPALRAAGGAVFATVTTLDGAFGFAAGPHGDPTAGALAGLAKTAGWEWPQVACKAIDVQPGLDAQMAADAIGNELFRVGPAEFGISEHGRVGLELTSAPLGDGVPPPFGPDDVIVITGGARGVTAEVAVTLAETCGPTLVLFGRSPEPAPEPADLAACPDEAALKRALAARSPGALPRQIGEQCRAVLAGREIRRTLDRIAAAGGRATYHSLDVRDRAAVSKALAAARRTAGPITGIIHGAGVLADRKIEDQTIDQFDDVYGTKVDGLRALLAATEHDSLKLLALFSSSTGRFGRAGQAAYAAANEALNKLAQRESRRRPACRVVAVNWGPWDGGMVTPGLRGLFAAERVGLIPLAAGARHLVREITANDRAPEVVVLGDGSVVPSRPQTADAPPPVAAPDLRVAFERELDLGRHPVLRAHVIDGRAVLPMALTVEWLAHAALHGNPGRTFHGLDVLKIFHPVIVAEDRPAGVRVLAGPSTADGDLFRVPVELRGIKPDGREVVFSRAEVLLAGDLPRGSRSPGEPALPAFPLDIDDVYRRILFHGPELRGIESIHGYGPDGIVVTAHTAPAPAAWVQQPLRGAWLADPLVLDCAFQALSVWCHAQRGAVSLPSALRKYRQYRRSFPPGAVRVIARVAAGAGQIVRAEIEFLDPAGALLARIEEYECVLDAALNAAFRRNRLEPAAV